MTSARYVSSVGTNRLRLILGAVAANLAIALPLARVLNIWQDEAYTLQTTSRGLAYAFAQAIGFEQNAPLYFLVMTLWRHAGDGVFFLRLFSVLCIALTVWLVPGLVSRYVPQIDGILVAAVIACNPFVVWAAVEMRVYALVLLLSALLLTTFFDAFLEERPSAAATIFYGVCVTAALYTQYYLAFLIGAQAVTLLIFNRKALGRFLLAGAAGALAFAPMLAIVRAEVANFKGVFSPPSFPESAMNLAGIGLRYVLPLPVVHAKNAYVVVLVLALLAAAIARPATRTFARSPVVVMSGLAFAFFAAGTFLSGVNVLDRHAASLFLCATLSVFALLAAVPSPAGRRAAIVWSALVMGLSLLTLGAHYRHLAKPGDWIRVTAYVRAHEAMGEPVVVFEAENALPFAYYYDGPNRVVPIPHGVDFGRYDVSRFIIHDAAELASVMPPARRIWLLRSGECASGNVQFGCGQLESFVARRYRVRSDVAFYGTRIRLIERVGPL